MRRRWRRQLDGSLTPGCQIEHEVPVLPGASVAIFALTLPVLEDGSSSQGVVEQDVPVKRDDRVARVQVRGEPLKLMRRREWSTLNRSDCLPQETKDLGPGRSKFWIGTRENVEFESCVDQFEVVFHVGVVQCGAKPAPDVLHELCVPAGWMIRLRLVETQFGCL